MRRWGPALGALALAAVVFGAGTTPERAPRPNLVLVVADDLGWGELGAYGNPRGRTPQLDALAAAGTRFEAFYASAPVCSPTRAALLTGRYPQRAGIGSLIFDDPERHGDHGLDPEEITLPRLLAQAGYATALFGKWHLGYAPKFHPLRHGFDEFRGSIGGNIDHVSHVDVRGALDWWQGGARRDEPGYSTELVTRHALRFLAEERERPFFLMLAYHAAHAPYQGPGDAPVRRAGEPGTPRRAPEVRQRAYGEMIAALDAGIGAVVAELRRLGLAERTLLFFASDGGPARFGRTGGLRGGKPQLFEGGIRVPAIAWGPGRVGGGRVAEELASTLDVMPTLLSAAGLAAPPGRALDGVDLMPLLRGGPAPAGRALFWELVDERAARAGPWKLLVRGGAGTRPPFAGLYHLERDAGERRNLAAEHPERVRELTGALERWRREVQR